MRENRIRNNKGITLIALVITIIVLIVLAGAAVISLTEEKSIIKKAIEGRNNSEAYDREENRIMQEYEKYMQNASIR